MKIKQKHLVFIYEQNGPTGSWLLREVIETEEGYYFKIGSSGGFFQMQKPEFQKSKEWTLKKMPELNVQHSQARGR